MKQLLLLIAVTTALLINAPTISAQDVASQTVENQQTFVSPIIKYYLAYPGILPDHPLYKLKVLRDKISAAIISDPIKKIDFYLLQTDKGILAAAMLVDKNKIELASETTLKAEHNYTLLTYQLYRISKKPNRQFFDRLENASLKHQEVLLSLIERLPKDKQEAFRQVIDFSKRNLETVRNYQKGNY